MSWATQTIVYSLILIIIVNIIIIGIHKLTYKGDDE